jgi:hypothetical protein
MSEHDILYYSFIVTANQRVARITSETCSQQSWTLQFVMSVTTMLSPVIIHFGPSDHMLLEQPRYIGGGPSVHFKLYPGRYHDCRIPVAFKFVESG